MAPRASKFDQIRVGAGFLIKVRGAEYYRSINPLLIPVPLPGHGPPYLFFH